MHTADIRGGTTYAYKEIKLTSLFSNLTCTACDTEKKKTQKKKIPQKEDHRRRQAYLNWMTFSHSKKQEERQWKWKLFFDVLPNSSDNSLVTFSNSLLWVLYRKLHEINSVETFHLTCKLSSHYHQTACIRMLVQQCNQSITSKRGTNPHMFCVKMKHFAFMASIPLKIS